ncbi:MAG: MerR family transcriptional regulator, partial [Dermabacteraceae bacterium]
GVFGIAVGRVWREVENDLLSLPGVDPADDAALALQDELAARRRSRQAG